MFGFCNEQIMILISFAYTKLLVVLLVQKLDLVQELELVVIELRNLFSIS